MEVHRLDFGPAQISRRIGDLEPAFARAVNQMRGGMGQILKHRLLSPQLHDPRRAAIAVPADHRVDLRLFAKAAESRRDDQEFAAVGHGHAGAVNRLVGHPGAAEFVALHHRDHLLERRHDGDVLLRRPIRRVVIGLEVVADEYSGVRQLAGAIIGHDHLKEEIRQPAQILVLRLIVTGPQRRDPPPEVVLDPAAGGHHVGGADHRFAAEADEVVLVVIGEPQHFVRHHMADIDDQIPRMVA
ncbi:hypothetical protein SDC9_155720 [bioreactor metagenome]|uniref:Uncharacterized protein n=1 Tax=bioreactor metagenome TaxID=1076179 RepID=A0A645F285_9ZZZZ